MHKIYIDECPMCHSTNIDVVDELDYGEYAVVCLNCGWEGSSSEMITEIKEVSDENE